MHNVLLCADFFSIRNCIQTASGFQGEKFNISSISSIFALLTDYSYKSSLVWVCKHGGISRGYPHDSLIKSLGARCIILKTSFPHISTCVVSEREETLKAWYKLENLLIPKRQWFLFVKGLRHCLASNVFGINPTLIEIKFSKGLFKVKKICG